MHDICCFCTGRMLCLLSSHISGGSLKITVDIQPRPCPRGILLRSLTLPPAPHFADAAAATYESQDRRGHPGYLAAQLRLTSHQ